MHQDDFDPPHDRPRLVEPTGDEPLSEGDRLDGESEEGHRRHRHRRRRHRSNDWSSLRLRYKKLFWIALAVVLALVVTWAVLVHVNVPPTGGDPVQHPAG